MTRKIFFAYEKKTKKEFSRFWSVRLVEVNRSVIKRMFQLDAHRMKTTWTSSTWLEIRKSNEKEMLDWRKQVFHCTTEKRSARFFFFLLRSVTPPGWSGLPFLIFLFTLFITYGRSSSSAPTDPGPTSHFPPLFFLRRKKGNDFFSSSWWNRNSSKLIWMSK